MSLIRFILPVALFASASFGQQIPRLELRLKNEAASPSEFAESLLNSVKCDRAGNLYLRPWQQLPNPLASPVLKMSPEGKRMATFSLASVPGFKESSFSDFALGGRGDVYLLVTDVKENKPEVEIVSFRDDGAYETAMKLPTEFLTAKIAVFPSGEFLVSGGKKIRSESGDIFEPYTAVVDRSGRVTKELTFPEDVKAEKQNDSGSAAVPVKQRRPPLVEIDTGEAVAGDDGNIYLMRRTSRPLVYVVSAGGELVRRFQVLPPSERAEPITMKYGGGGRLLFEFAERSAEKSDSIPRKIFSVVDSQSGQTLLEYETPAEVGGAFACYSPNGFTFMGTAPDGHLSVRIAVPH